MIQVTKSASHSLLLVALAAALAVSATVGTAFADAPAAIAAPAGNTSVAVDSPPATVAKGVRVSVAGEVARYVVGPLGHVRGFLLRDGTSVLIHGDTDGDIMAKAVPVGQSVRVEGFAPAAGGKSIRRAAVYGQHGQIIAAPTRPADNGTSDREGRKERWTELREEVAKLPDASANGTVQNIITGHRGKTMAVVLNDGTSVFLRPSLARAVEARGIRVGDRIESTGKGAKYPLGASVVISSITFADGTRFEAKSGQGAPRG